MQVDAVTTNIEELEAAVRKAVLNLGMSVRGCHLQAVWNKGRVSWNTKALEGYALAHPEVEALRNVGDPSVSIRLAK